MPDRRATIETTRTRSKRLSSLVRYGPWVLLAGAALFYVVRFVPGFFLATMDTETIVLPVFYQDIVEHHHSATTWGWGGFSALFPDVTVFFWLNYLFRDGRLALVLLEGCFFIGWLAATIALVIELRRPHKLSLISILLLLWVGATFGFGFPNDWGLDIWRSLLIPVYHSGTGLLTLICLVLLLGQISGAPRIGFWWLLVLTFLGSTSDLLFDIVFVGPAMASTSLLALAFRRQWKRHLTLTAIMGIAAAAGYYLTPWLFPAELGTSGYIEYPSPRLNDSLQSFQTELFRPEHHFFLFVMVLDALTVLGGIGGVLFFCFSSRRKYISSTVFMLMVFCSCTILLNWFSVLILGDYPDFNANRYTTVALLIPLFLLAFGLHAIIFWRPWLEAALAVTVSTFTVIVAFIPQQSTINYDCTTEDIPFLKNLMKENHIQSALGNYWSSNIVTFLSRGEVPVRSLTNDARIYKWFNNLEWFGKGHPLSEWPRFRMIYYPDPGYSGFFGKPDEVIHTPRGSEIWLYSEAHSIRYCEYFDILSNSLLDDGRTLPLKPANLPGASKIEGDSRIANDGDPEGWLEFGPYLSLEPGRYRVTFHYTVSTPWAEGRGPTYDILIHHGTKERSINGVELPNLNVGPQVFTDEFVAVTPNDTYEMRIYHHGSGTIRIDGLNVTYLSP
jgi:hypothetical protein